MFRFRVQGILKATFRKVSQVSDVWIYSRRTDSDDYEGLTTKKHPTKLGGFGAPNFRANSPAWHHLATRKIFRQSLTENIWKFHENSMKLRNPRTAEKPHKITDQAACVCPTSAYFPILAVKEPKDAIEVQWQQDQRRQTVQQRQEWKPLRPCRLPQKNSAETGASWKMLEAYGNISWVTPISISPHITVDIFVGPNALKKIPRTTVPSQNGLWSWWCSESVWNQSTHFRHIVGCIQCLVPTIPNHTSHGMVLIPVCTKTRVVHVVNVVSSQGTRWAWAPSEWQFQGSCCQCSLRCFSAGGY